MTPFEDERAVVRLEQRLGVLVRHYKAIAPAMSDLPLYNERVGVDAVDFMPFGEMGFGALVTPWFINAVFLPLEPVTYDPASVGRIWTVELPAGQRSFTLGGDEGTGLFWAHSLLSPLELMASHDAAVAFASAKLAELLTGSASEDRTARPAVERSHRTPAWEQRA